MLSLLVESVRRQQEQVIEYLRLENQVLREKLGGNRVLLSDEQRRRLAVKGKALGRSQLKKIATIAQADTILRWHRELIGQELGQAPGGKTGRPRKDQEIVDLVLRMARENESWGYKRIAGEMSNLGYSIGKSTVANILKRHGIEPAPLRKLSYSWSKFLKSHWDAFAGMDLNEIKDSILNVFKRWFGITYPADRNEIPLEAREQASLETRSPSSIRIFECNFSEVSVASGPPIQSSDVLAESVYNFRRAA